ncbi:tyrosine-type recombinase/integrase [Alphaproteobacteria bacterium LSUCC0684]
MNIEKLFTSLEGAYAPNTIKAYRSDLEHLTRWSQQNKLNPLSLSGTEFVQYLEEMGQSLTVATMSRRVASISRLLDLLKQPNPTKEPDVILGLKRLKRNLGIAQKQATPLTLEVMRKLQAVCDNTILGLRNRLLLQLGYESMRRRSEICAFKFEDVKILPNGKHVLLLRKSKTDQFGEGKLIPISDELVEMISHWQDKIKQTDGYILRSFKRDLSIRESLVPAALNKILKFLQRKAKLKDIGELSGHSFRVGAAIDLLDKGVPLERIMLRGGWKSENTALRYLRNWDDSDWLLI